MFNRILWALAAFVVIYITTHSSEIGDAMKRASERTERSRYERNHPCINGVRYIRSGYDAGASLTPMIDPATMAPQLCGPEAAG